MARKKRKQEDRDRKKALVPCGCHLRNRNLWSVKKKRWHKSVVGDNVLYVQAKTATYEEDRETDNQGRESSGTIIRGIVQILLAAIS